MSSISILPICRPLLRKVEKIGQTAVGRKSLPFEIQQDDFFKQTVQLKRAFAQLISAPDWERIAIIPSASYGIANVANNLPVKAGGEILVVEDQFPSNVYSWMRKAKEASLHIRTIKAPPPSPDKGTRWNDAILAAIHSATVLVALPHVHWSEGILFDLKAIRQKTRLVNALLVIDGTQSVGAYPFSIGDIEPDALICGGYKMVAGSLFFGACLLRAIFRSGSSH